MDRILNSRWHVCNRSGMGWFFLALILSPLLAIAFAAILREKPTQVIFSPLWEDFTS
jgi:hypothetical protein